MLLGAIDIGSNAIRLLFSNVFEDQDRVVFKKLSLTRVPIRLGEDVFPTGRISDRKARALIKSMIAFKHLIEVHEPLDCKAYATSAMRNAENAPEIIEEVNRQTGIQIEMISGQREAEIIYSTHIAEDMLKGSSYLYIEVGGGSTEVSLFASGQNIFSRSFSIGTVRMLYGLVAEEQWKEMREWLKANVAGYKPVVGIGTGGNINTILKLVRKKEGKPFSIRKIREMRDYLNSFSLEERIKGLGLRPDRADVIVPATDIYLSVMKWCGIEKIFVPKIGVADGIIHELYERYRGRNQSSAV